MLLYHGTPIENLESILADGLIPMQDIKSEDPPVVWLTTNAELALLNAYHVDVTKVAVREKDRKATGYVALEVNANSYEPATVEVGYYWVLRTIKPSDLIVVRQENFETIRQLFREKVLKV